MMQRADALLQGWPGLLAAYATVQAPLLAGLARARAPLRQLLLSPLLGGAADGRPAAALVRGGAPRALWVRHAARARCSSRPAWR